ncbi:MAG TPA: CBS domain-containing protein [Haliangiales bacterium]|nr:CBS domain-containing protein [Haliangiales bacterium]
MTASPVTIGRDQTLTVAHKLMREHRIRHLPVLERGRLVGIVSQRDLHFVETLRDVDPSVVLVEDAMTEPPFTVAPGARLETVAREMAARRIGSAVVVERGKVVGVFTAVDGLRGLADVLARPATAQRLRRRAG